MYILNGGVMVMVVIMVMMVMMMMMMMVMMLVMVVMAREENKSLVGGRQVQRCTSC